MRALSIILLYGFCLFGSQLFGMIRPERTDWKETTRHGEVLQILKTAAETHPRMHYTTLGYTNEGREIPLLVIGPDYLPTPEQAITSQTLRVYLQGNIHAGEVAGKEALLRLVKKLSTGWQDPWTRDWMLLINPNYNPDGNERIHLENRLLQHGPIGGMGTRENAQGLDLNRDQTKLDTPESRVLARLLTTWDPHVTVDMHTTNGTFHGYHLTYSPPLHPGTPPFISEFLYETFLPEVTQATEAASGWKIWHYGNLSTKNGVEGWYTFDPRPRYVTNYIGLRNRVAILSEAYSYLTFQDRVQASEYFVEAILTVLYPQREALGQSLEALDGEDLRGSSFPLHGKHAEHPPEMDLILGEVEVERHPYTGGKLYRRTADTRQVRVPTSIRFEPIQTIEVPAGYLVSAEAEDILERLTAHGIIYEAISKDSIQGYERFAIQSWSEQQRNFQGRFQQSVDGTWAPDTGNLPDSLYFVPLNQPLARLAMLLLEPDSPDGFLNWGFFDSWVKKEDSTLPLWRIPYR